MFDKLWWLDKWVRGSPKLFRWVAVVSIYKRGIRKEQWPAKAVWCFVRCSVVNPWVRLSMLMLPLHCCSACNWFDGNSIGPDGLFQQDNVPYYKAKMLQGLKSINSPDLWEFQIPLIILHAWVCEPHLPHSFISTLHHGHLNNFDNCPLGNWKMG